MSDNLLPPDPAPNPPNQAHLAQFFQQLLLSAQLNILMKNEQLSVHNHLSMLPISGLTTPTLPVNNLPDFNLPTPQDRLAMKDITIAQQLDLINIQQEEIKFLKAREQRLKSKKPSQPEEEFLKQQVYFMNREAYHNEIRAGWMVERNQLMSKVTLLDEEVSKLKLENETLKVKETEKNSPKVKSIEEFVLEARVQILKKTVGTLEKRASTQWQPRRRPFVCNPLTLLFNPGQVDQMIQQTLARRATLTPQELFVEKIKLGQFVKNIGKYYEAVSKDDTSGTKIKTPVAEFQVITIDDDDVEEDGPTPAKRPKTETLEDRECRSTKTSGNS